MKKTLALLIPSVLAFSAHAASPVAPTDASQGNADSQHIQYFSHHNVDQNGRPVAQGQNLDVNSAMLGYNGPFSLSLTDDSLYGLITTAQLTQALGQSNAVSLLVDGGKNEWRGNVTWGIAFSANQRIKASAEYLKQNMTFDFDSGKVKDWDAQQAYGAAYQFLFPHQFFNAINISGSYSRADSQDLGYKGFVANNGLYYRNFRRIAGGETKNGTVGIDLLPTRTTLLGVAANYNNVTYRMKYDTAPADSPNQSGFGATLSLQQLLTKHVKFQLLASRQKPISTYQAELDYLIATRNGGVEVGLQGTRDLAVGTPLPSDKQIGLHLSYQWGMSSTPASYSVDSASAESNLSGWVQNPVVKMSQVLAVADQKDVQWDLTPRLTHLDVCSGSMPRPSPSFTPPVQDLNPGQNLGNGVDLGVAGNETGANAWFVSPELYPLDRLRVTGLNGTGLSLLLRNVGGVDHIFLTGKVSSNAPVSATVSVEGLNTFPDGECPTQTLHINFGSVQVAFSPAAPWADIVKARDANTAFPATHFVTLTPEAGDTITSVDFGTDSTTSHDLAYYGITASFANNKETFASTNILHASLAQENIPMTIHYTSGTQSRTQTDTLSFGIQGVPVNSTHPAVDLGHVEAGNPVTPGQATGFQNPVNSPAMSYELCADAAGSSCVAEGAQDPSTDLSVSATGQVSGTIKTDATIGVHNLYVFAQNTIGKNLEADAVPVTVNVVPPQGNGVTINFTPSTVPWTLVKARDGNTVFPTDHFVSFTPDVGNTVTGVSFGTDPATTHTLAYYGITATYDAAANRETFTSTNVLHASLAIENIPMTVSYNTPTGERRRDATLSFSFQGVPFGSESPTAIAFGNVHVGASVGPQAGRAFSNPYNSGAISYQLCDATGTTCPAAGEFGLTVNASGQVSGTVAAGTALGAHTTYVFARNGQGNNIATQAIPVTLTVTAAPATNVTLQCPSASSISYSNGAYRSASTDSSGSTYTAASRDLEAGATLTTFVGSQMQAGQLQCIYDGTTGGQPLLGLTLNIAPNLPAGADLPNGTNNVCNGSLAHCEAEYNVTHARW